MMNYAGPMGMSYPGMGFRFGGSSLAHARQVAATHPNKVTQFSGQNLGKADMGGVQKLMQQNQAQAPMQTTTTPMPPKMAADDDLIAGLSILGDFWRRKNAMLGQMNIQDPNQQAMMQQATAGTPPPMPPSTQPMVQPPMAPTSGMQQPGGSPPGMPPGGMGMPLGGMPPSVPTTAPQSLPPTQEPPLPRTTQAMPDVVDQLIDDKQVSKANDGMGELKADLQGFGAEKLGQDLVQPTMGDRLRGLTRGGTLGATLGGLLGTVKSPFVQGPASETVGRHFLSGGATGLGAVGGAQLGSRYGIGGELLGGVSGGVLANLLSRKLLGKRKKPEEEKEASDGSQLGQYFCPKCGTDETWKDGGTAKCEPCGHVFNIKDAKSVPQREKIGLSLDLLRRAFSAAAQKGGRRLEQFSAKAEPYLNSTVLENGSRMPRLQSGQLGVMSKMAPRQAVMDYTDRFQNFQNQVGSVNQGFNLINTIRQSGTKLLPQQKQLIIQNAMKGVQTPFSSLGFPIPKQIANARTEVIPQLQQGFMPQRGMVQQPVLGPPPVPKNMQMQQQSSSLPQAPNLKFGMLKESITAKLVGNAMRSALQKNVTPERLVQFQNRINSWAPAKFQQNAAMTRSNMGAPIVPGAANEGFVGGPYSEQLKQVFGTPKTRVYMNPNETDARFINNANTNAVMTPNNVNTLMHEMGHASRQTTDPSMLSKIVSDKPARNANIMTRMEGRPVTGRGTVLQEYLANRAVQNRLPQLQQLGLDPAKWQQYVKPQMEGYRLHELQSLNNILSPGDQKTIQSIMPSLTGRQRGIANDYLSYLQKNPGFKSVSTPQAISSVPPASSAVAAQQPEVYKPLGVLSRLKALFGKSGGLLNIGGMERSTSGDGTKKFLDAGPTTYGNQAWKDSEKWMRSEAKSKSKAKLLLDTKEASDSSDLDVKEIEPSLNLTKLAWVGRLLGGMERLGQGASRVGQMGERSYQAAKPWLSPIGNTALGGAGGYMYGEDTGIGGGAGALMGASAMNPYLRRLAGKGYAGAPLQAVRTGITGDLAGVGIDSATNLTGLTNDSNRFSRAGAYLGTSLGLGKGMTGGLAKQMIQNKSMTPEIGKGLGKVYGGLNRGERALGEFGGGTVDPLIGLGKGVIRTGAKLTGAQVPSWAMKTVGQNPGLSRILGRVAGGTAVGGFGFGIGSNVVGSKLNDAVNQKFTELYGAGRDQAVQDFQGALGFNQGGPVDQTVSKFDNLLMGLGLDPSQMSPGRKLAIIGGGGAGLLGTATGHPMMALGGLSTLALSRPQQFLPHATSPDSSSTLNQMNMPEARNELQLQTDAARQYSGGGYY